MKSRISASVLALGLALALPLPQVFADSAKKPTPAMGDEVLMTLTATIEAIKLDTREVSLKGPAGNVYTFVVDPAVTRLAEFKVGDAVTIDYYASLAAELREPTAEEKAEPLAILQDAGKGDAGAAPKAGGYRIIRALVTIEGLDGPTSTATLKGPRGNMIVVQVKDAAKLRKVRLGDTLVVVYTEAFAVRLEKAPAAPTAAKATP
jgi:hypothetical protein